MVTIAIDGWVQLLFCWFFNLPLCIMISCKYRLILGSFYRILSISVLARNATLEMASLLYGKMYISNVKCQKVVVSVMAP